MRVLRRVYRYQKKALMGFLGASTSFFLLVFFSGLSSFSGFWTLPLAAAHKLERECLSEGIGGNLKIHH